MNGYKGKKMNDEVLQAPVKNSKNPLISVVLPVYNGEKYLVEAINSILAQTFEDFELVIIDDGSTDASLKILLKYQSLDSRIRVITRENQGLAKTLNDLIDIARGEWIARMDQDDIALPIRFERQLDWLNKTGADISGSWVKRFGTSDKRVVKLRQTDEAIKVEMLFCSPFVHPTVMMRSILAKQLRYNSAWEKAEDYDLWERCAEAGWKMTNQPEVLLQYRIHESQISTATQLRQQDLGYQIQLKYWKYTFEKLHLDQSGVDQVLGVRKLLAHKPNMDAIEATFDMLCQRVDGEEAKDAVWDHLARLYFHLAADCPCVISRWKKLNKHFNKKVNFSTLVKLWILRLLRIRSDSALFKGLKKLHISLV